jgi:hypothetical protein
MKQKALCMIDCPGSPDDPEDRDGKGLPELQADGTIELLQ